MSSGFRLLICALVTVSVGCASTLDTPGTVPNSEQVRESLCRGTAQTNRVSELRQPQLHIDGSVDRDFCELATRTWGAFLTTFRGRTSCFGDVHLRAVYKLEDRAVYDPATATVTVRVPGSAAMLSSALIHEWAHHVEFQCPAHQSFRSTFLAAQGLPSDALWQSDDAPADMPERDWAQIPSELYAEAAIEAVLGSRPVPTTAKVTKEAVSTLVRWAAGDH